MKIKFILVFTLIFMCKSYSQVVTTITNILVNNQTTVSNCNLIDFGTNSNNSLTIYFKLTKPSNQAVGNCDLDILLKYNTGSYGNSRANIILQSGGWINNNTEFIGQITANISASEIQLTGSSIYIECKTSSGVKSQSCEYPLTKTPTPEFKILPGSSNISCGNTSIITFSVYNVNNSQGTKTYSWYVGNGWSLPDGTPVSGTLTDTSSTILLKPASQTILPSTVFLTVTLNGVEYYDSSPVIRSPVSQTITAISGASTLCSGSTNYNFGTENVLTGQTVTWSLSNSTVATLSNASNTGVTLNLIGNGGVTLTATIADACGQSYSKTKNLFGGAPPAIAVTRGTAQSEYCDIKYHYVPFIINKPIGASLSFPFLYPNATYSSVSNGNDEYTYTFAFLKGFSGYFNMYAELTNSCGSSTYESEGDFYIQSCSEIQSMASSNKSTLDTIFKIYPNPSNDVVYLDLVDANNVPEKNAEISASLYDMLGFEKEKVKIKDNKAVIDVSALPSGLYVLRLNINGETETHLISIK
ncbi:T9SS type A sorting domain-containing protein [Mariniflexile sp. HNIBRBA6329]|uniref:T9SS type A sorting domain-containing protein n=1 Tax=Mariniflexile sp. HNIBRBA6329 TaxID=3373088 RepID=UPI003745F2F6